MLADILPTGYEVGVLNGAGRARRHRRDRRRRPDRAGRDEHGPAVLPEPDHRVDPAEPRLAPPSNSAPTRVDRGRDDPVAVVRTITGGLGADVAMEAVVYRQPSSCAPGWSVPAGTSPTSASTASPRRCTWSPLDPQHHDHHRSGGHQSTPTLLGCSSRPAGHLDAGDASVPDGRLPRRLHRVRRSGPQRRPQGPHHDLTGDGGRDLASRPPWGSAAPGTSDPVPSGAGLLASEP